MYNRNKFKKSTDTEQIRIVKGMSFIEVKKFLEDVAFSHFGSKTAFQELARLRIKELYETA